MKGAVESPWLDRTDSVKMNKYIPQSSLELDRASKLVAMKCFVIPRNGCVRDVSRRNS